MTSVQVGEPITIEEAYDELTQQAFAVWMRLMTAQPQQLVGRAAIARMVRYSSSYCDEILRELKHKGYIKFEKAPPGKPSKLIIYRRALLSGPTSFITLTHSFRFTDQEKLCEKPKKSFCFWGATSIPSMKNGVRKKCAHLPDESSGKLSHFSASSNAGDEDEKMCKMDSPNGKAGKKRKSRRKKSSRKKPANQKAGKKTTIGIVGEKLPKTRVKAAKEPDELDASKHDRPEGSEGENPSAAINKGVSLTKFREKFNEIKKERSDRGKKSKIRARGPLRKVDWEKLDQRGSPTISFTPSDEKREVMISILERSDRDSKKKALVKKLASEFGRIYSRYRRMLQKKRGSKPTYLLPKQERKYAGRAAEWCIRKSLTPRQVLEYWHANIGNFADNRMTIPPLVFLSGPANIDTVACAELEEPKKKNAGHGFSDERELDYRLRPGLENAGFETHMFNDRYLLTIQKTAQAIAKGARLFVGSEMKPLVNWAAKNLYAN